MESLKPRSLLAALAAASVLTVVACSAQRTESSSESLDPPAKVLRLYVFDCGTLKADLARFRLKKEEVATSDHVVLPDLGERDLTLRKPLMAQLAEVGYSPADITYLALSHYHYDHTANANAFAGATWLVRQVERDAMFAEKPPGVTQPSSYAALRNSKTVVIERDEYDVVGDGSVVIKLAAGHTPGHQVLYVKLPKTGGVVLSGDLYHFPEARTLKRVATFDFDQAQTPVSRDTI